MEIDLKVLFLILAIFCQFYVDGLWGSSRRYGGGRSSSRRFTSIRTPSRRGRLWSSSRTPSLRRTSYRTPRIRRLSVRRRSWWGRRRIVRKPRVRRPSVRRRSWWVRRRIVRRPRVRRPSVRRRSWWVRRRIVRRPRVRRPSVRRRSWWVRRRIVRRPRVRRPSVRRRSWWVRRRIVRKPRVRRPSVRRTSWRRRTPSARRRNKPGVNKLLKGKTMSEIVAGFEGIKKSVYKDHKGIKTVGVGFNMQQPSARKDFKKYVPGKSFDKVLAGKQSLTKKEALSLFKGTLNDKVKTTKRLFPKYDTYPKAVKTALVNGVFRGEFKSTQKTVKYINSGQWDKVANEYLDRKDYRNSKPGKNGGIKTRMDYNAKIFREYAKERKG